MEKTEIMQLLEESRNCLKKGALDEGKKLLKESVQKLLALPEEDQWQLIGEYERIQETFAKITLLEQIVMSYQRDPQKTEEYADLLRMKTKERRKTIYNRLEEVLG